VAWRPNIEAVLDQTLALNCPGLVTLDRARLLADDIDPLGIEDEVNEVTKLTLYFGRQDTVFQVPAFEVICDLLYKRGIAGATHCSVSTAPLTAAASGPGSSAATLMSRWPCHQ
jgi:hypothetical protein